MCETQLSCYHGGVENMYVWTILQTIENEWDSNLFVGCSLFDFYAKCGSKKIGKMVPIVFGSKTYIWMRKYKIVVIVFSFDFEGEMNCLIPLCVHEKKCITNIHASWVCSKSMRNLLFYGFISFTHECHALFKQKSHVHDFRV